MKPFSKEHYSKARNLLAEQGTEMTPEELMRETRAAFKNIREKLLSLGYKLPDSDIELLRLLKRMNIKT